MNEKKMLDVIIDLTDGKRESVKDTVHAVWEYILAKSKKNERIDRMQSILSKVNLFDVFPGEHTEQIASQMNGILSSNERISVYENQTILGLIRKQMAEKDFYTELFRRIQDDIFTVEEKEIFFLCTWLDMRIPYYQLEDVQRMQDEEFKRVMDELKAEINKANYIMSLYDSQYTQQATWLMHIAKTIPDESKQSVFWAAIFSRLTEQAFQTGKQDRK